MAAICAGLLVTACGGEDRQDEAEPEGEFPVRVTTSEFPERQRLAQTSVLSLGIQNAGSETIPELAVTIETEGDPEGQVVELGDEELAEEEDAALADESFSVLIEREGVAIPSRPVWILETGYPRFAGDPGPAGADTAATRTFAFGPLEPGEAREIQWRVTPVQSGEFTVSYSVAAGLYGRAVAVAPDGSEPGGEFEVRISDVPPQTRVDERGRVVRIQPGDIIGEAGTGEQREELDGDD